MLTKLQSAVISVSMKSLIDGVGLSMGMHVRGRLTGIQLKKIMFTVGIRLLTDFIDWVLRYRLIYGALGSQRLLQGWIDGWMDGWDLMD